MTIAFNECADRSPAIPRCYKARPENRNRGKKTGCPKKGGRSFSLPGNTNISFKTKYEQHRILTKRRRAQNQKNRREEMVERQMAHRAWSPEREQNLFGGPRAGKGQKRERTRNQKEEKTCTTHGHTGALEEENRLNGMPPKKHAGGGRLKRKKQPPKHAPRGRDMGREQGAERMPNTRRELTPRKVYLVGTCKREEEGKQNTGGHQRGQNITINNRRGPKRRANPR